MNEVFAEFLKIYLPAILYAMITAIAAIVAKGIVAVYNRIANTKEKREVAKIVVLAVEQIFKTLHGPDKFDKALEFLLKLLSERGIPITETEAKTLIEAAVGEFNNVFFKDIEPLPSIGYDTDAVGFDTEE